MNNDNAKMIATEAYEHVMAEMNISGEEVENAFYAPFPDGYI
jgi:hypothetical protein